MVQHLRSAAALVCVGVIAVAMAGQDGDTNAPLDTASGHYIEDGLSRRRLATIDAELVRAEGGVALRLRIAAVGVGIDAVPGFHGIAGGNHITGREIQRLLDCGGLDAATVTPIGERRPATYRAGRHGRVPERRFERGRGLVLDGQSEAEVPLELLVSGTVVSRGSACVELRVDGTPRLRVWFDADRDQIGAIESLGVDLWR
jgi:hypothetical protein